MNLAELQLAHGAQPLAADDLSTLVEIRFGSTRIATIAAPKLHVEEEEAEEGEEEGEEGLEGVEGEEGEEAAADGEKAGEATEE